jgi:ferredoxin
MKIEIKDYCIRCGLCEDLYPQLFRLNTEDDKIDLLYEEDIPTDLEEAAKAARRDCAIACIFLN